MIQALGMTSWEHNTCGFDVQRIGLLSFVCTKVRDFALESATVHKTQWSSIALNKACCTVISVSRILRFDDRHLTLIINQSCLKHEELAVVIEPNNKLEIEHSSTSCWYDRALRGYVAHSTAFKHEFANISLDSSHVKISSIVVEVCL